MKAVFTPLALLAAILTFSLWNGAVLTDRTERLRNQLRQTDALAQAEDWPAAEALLLESYRDWSSWQTYLHIVSQHDAADEAEALYGRCLVYAEAGEGGSFRAELAGLREQLRLLAEMERFSARNIL